MVKFNKIGFPNLQSLFDPSYLKSVVDFHKSELVFAKRPITTFLIENSSKYFKLSISDSFVLINFFFLFLHGLVIFYLSKFVIKNENNSIKNIIIYYSSFSILFIFFAPIYSYDEPIHYFFLLSSLLFFLRSKMLIFSILFLISLITRESSLIFSIGFFYYTLLNYKNKKSLIFDLLYIGIPIIIYLYYSYLFNNMNNQNILNEINSRTIGIIDNFRNLKFTIETIFSFYNTVLFPLYFIYIFFKNGKIGSLNLKLYKSFFAVLIVNTILVILGMSARESRLFFLPVLFIVPYFYLIFDEIRFMYSYENFTIIKNNKNYIFIIILICAISFFLAKKVYQTTLGSDNEHLINEYTFITISLVLIHYFLNKFLNKILNKKVNI